MLASALKFGSDLDLSNSVEISSLLKSFARERPQASNLAPKWDLDLVLWSLLESPFEKVWDEKSCPLQYLTWKAVFLLLLASGNRRGEIQAIPLDGVSFASDNSKLTLRPDPSFISKTQLRTGEALRPIVIPALRNLVGDEDERKLCPYRVIQAYVKRTKPIRGSRKLLFISFKPGCTKEIHPNTISAWVMNLIEYCYRQPGKKAIQLTGRTTHEVRAYSATLLHKGCFRLEDILQSGSWSSSQVFVQHYLRSVSEVQEDGLKRLGPLVVGRQVVQL